jgi:hypothetical protein
MHPKIFISYSHDSLEHKKWVLNLATRLMHAGVDTILDQWDLKLGADLPTFMERGISESSRVLLVCTDRYVEKANSGSGGVGYEKMIVTSEIFQHTDSKKFIPVLRQNGSVNLPTFLKSKLFIDFSKDENFETAIDELLREILGAPLFEKPKLGNNPFQFSDEKPKRKQLGPVEQLMKSIAAVYSRAGSDGTVRVEWVKQNMNVSKLFFDHALDQAESLGYLFTCDDREVICVLPDGRTAMINLENV